MSKRAEAECRRLGTDRKQVEAVYVVNIKNTATGEVYFSRATVVDVSPTGILLGIDREHILSLDLRSNLTLDPICNTNLGFTIEIMDTYIEGDVARTAPNGSGQYVVAVDFRDDAPDYWRQAFVDILPGRDE